MTLTYSEAEKTLGTARNPEQGKPLANNTRLFRRGEDFAIRFHATDIITIHPDGTYTLNSGGYRTMTTKERINEYSPVRMWQGENIWWVRNTSFEDAVLFTDGMKVDANGVPIGTPSINPRLYIRAQRKLTRMVGKFISGWIKSLQESREFPLPSSGDCWYCTLTISGPKGNPDIGKPMGHNDPSHIISHMEESYYVPSLLWNAFLERNIQPQHSNGSWYKQSSDARQATQNQLGMVKYDVEHGRLRSDDHLIESALRQYFRLRRESLVMYLYRQMEAKANSES